MAAIKLLLLSFIFVSIFCNTLGKLKITHEWKYIDYLWESPDQEYDAIVSGIYSKRSALPINIDKSKDGRIFVVLEGSSVPATLAEISDRVDELSGPLVSPYPDWSWHTNTTSCEYSIISIQGIAIDRCNRLWAVDTGIRKIDSYHMCPAKLLSFDLETNRLLYAAIIPDSILKNEFGFSGLANIAVEHEGDNCEDTTIYISDPVGHSLIVYTGSRFHRIESESFEPTLKTEYLGDENDSLFYSKGVFGISLSPSLFVGESRFLYYRPLDSLDFYAIDTNKVKNGQNFQMHGLKNILPYHVIGQAFSSNGTLFMGQTGLTGITCWNRYRDFTASNIEFIAGDEALLPYPVSLKVVPASDDTYDDELLVLSNRHMRKHSYEVNPYETNFMLSSGSVKKLTKYTKCEMPEGTRFALEEMFI